MARTGLVSEQVPYTRADALAVRVPLPVVDRPPEVREQVLLPRDRRARAWEIEDGILRKERANYKKDDCGLFAFRTASTEGKKVEATRI